MDRTRLAYILAFILWGVLALAGCGRTSVPPTATAAEGQVLFLDQGALYIMNVDGSGRKKLGDGVKQYHLSPDCTKVALVIACGEPAERSYGLYTTNVDGTGWTVLSENINVKRPEVVSPVEGSVDWSPDSTRLAFAMRDGGIHIIDADGGNRVQLAEYQRNPVWSPDGRRIACTRDRDLWIVDGDGGNSRRLVRSIGHGYVPTPKGVWAEEWSPDGQWILYSDFSPPFEGSVWYHIVNAEAGGPIETPGFPIYWSPDGKRIAFRDTGVLWISKPDGSDAIEVAGSVSRMNHRVAWSPDGAYIAWVTEGEDLAAEDIFVAEVDGSNQIKVNNARLTFCPELNWSPDCQHLVFWRPEEGMYVARADGGFSIKLHDTGDCPLWSQDGQVLAFGAQDGFHLAAAGRQWNPILVHKDWSLSYSDSQWIPSRYTGP